MVVWLGVVTLTMGYLSVKSALARNYPATVAALAVLGQFALLWWMYVIR